jgi:beta-glucosidase
MDAGVSPYTIRGTDLEVISTPIDFLGVNYYHHWIVRARADDTGAFAPANLEYVTDVPSATFTTMGWEVCPHGLNLLLEELSRTYRPECLLITENGADFEDSWNGNGRISDPQRIVYLREHLQAVACALHHVVPVAGGTPALSPISVRSPGAEDRDFVTPLEKDQSLWQR